MDSKETHQQQQNRNAAAALSGPISTSQAMQHRSSVGALSLRQPQQLPMLAGSPYYVVDNQHPSIEQRGRGRPRKYAPPDANSSAGSGPPAKRGRGLPPPPASGNNQRRNNALGGEGEEDESITAHIINVNAGEDIAMKLVAFMNQEPRELCVLSASGTVSCAVLQSKTPLGVVKYEGLYLITDMSGTFLNTESYDGATVTRTGNLNVSLAGPDAKIWAGRVGGMLVAGSEVKVILGIFGPERVKPSEASSEPANVLSLSGGGPGFPQSQGPQCSSESSEENASTSLGNSTPQPSFPLAWQQSSIGKSFMGRGSLRVFSSLFHQNCS
ncbi:AT-hook motif nuclear-localized protein 13 [Raphanus sativus]|nr:AT-hook motif nuclear-localized protein 13 [Raphanus sativus]